MCGRQPAAGRGPARCERRSDLYPAPAGQRAGPSESPGRSSTLGGRQEAEESRKAQQGRRRKQGLDTKGLGGWLQQSVNTSQDSLKAEKEKM